jgi:acetyl esterase/lipase
VLPSPSQKFAFLAILVDEKSFLLIAAALLGALLAYLGGAGRWSIAGLSMALAAFACGVGLVPPLQALHVARARHVSLDWKRYLLAGADLKRPRPDQTLVFANIEGHPLSLDVYRPPASRGPVPAVIVIHGGGWTDGDKGEVPTQTERLAAQGYAIFDVQYRLAPPASWQRAVGDIKCAIGWVKQHGREAGVEIDPARVTLLGRSAGGHLALMAAYTDGDPDFPPSCPSGDTRVESVIAFYAPTDMGWAYQHPTNPRVYTSSERLRALLGGSPVAAEEAYAKSTVANHITARVPRTLLLHGNQDQFVSPAHPQFVAPRLRAVGVSCDLVIIPYGQHGFDYVVGGLGNQIAESAVLRFLAAGGSV